MRNRALLTLEKTQTLIAERAKYLASLNEAALVPAAKQNQFSLKHAIYSQMGDEDDHKRLALMENILGPQKDNEKLIPLAEEFADAQNLLTKLKSSRASLLSAFDNKKTKIACENRAELRDLAFSKIVLGSDLETHSLNLVFINK